MRVSPNNSRKDLPTPHIQTDHPDFSLWVNHDTDLTVIDFRDCSTATIQDYFTVSEEVIIPVGLSLSVATGVIISIGYTIDLCEYRRYFMTRCDKDTGNVIHSELKQLADPCSFSLN